MLETTTGSNCPRHDQLVKTASDGILEVQVSCEWRTATRGLKLGPIVVHQSTRSTLQQFNHSLCSTAGVHSQGRFVAVTSPEGHSFTAILQCASKVQYLGNGDFRSGEIEIKETLIAVVLNSAHCTVLTVQIILAKLGLTKVHLHPTGVSGSGA
jgi:hypothetical protein